VNEITSKAHMLVGKLYNHCYATFHHSLRVGDELYNFAKYLGLDDLENIYLLGILHDIGKLDIPHSLLNKKAPLTTEEFEELKLHTIYGQLRIRQMKCLPSYYAECAKYHHENVDSTGYFGLRDSSIPLLAKMIRLVDSYDTMKYGRIYQSPKSHEDIMNEIYLLSGKHYDSQLVVKFADFHKRKAIQMAH
jgi:HD-GYP domain-containing protein (c-di-GMP phosphodiesterase class II)